MQRRSFLQASIAAVIGTPVMAALKQERLDDAVDVLKQATESRQVESASLYVRQREMQLSRAFGKAASVDAMFLLGSISKPIAMTALMTLFDQGAFQLDDPLQKFLPKFAGEGREKVTLRHVLSLQLLKELV